MYKKNTKALKPEVRAKFWRHKKTYSVIEITNIDIVVDIIYKERQIGRERINRDVTAELRHLLFF